MDYLDELGVQVALVVRVARPVVANYLQQGEHIYFLLIAYDECIYSFLPMMSGRFKIKQKLWYFYFFCTRTNANILRSHK